MPTARPNSDVLTTGWTDQAEGTTDLFSKINEVTESTSSYIQTTIDFTPPPGPVVLIVLDDLNRNAISGGNTDPLTEDYATILPGFGLPGREGTRVCENIWSQIIEQGTDFRHHIGSRSPCWTNRCEIQTSLFYKNHKMFTNSQANYYAVYENPLGRFEAVSGRPTPEQAGPYAYSLATTLPATRVPVTDSAHAALLRHATDDVQAFTGWFGTELARAGYPVGIFGKWNNPFDPNDSNVIPAGCEYARISIHTATSSNWTIQESEYTGSNPWNGTGVTAPDSTQVAYSRGNATSASYSSSNGGEVTVSGVSAGHAFEAVDGIIPGPAVPGQIAGLRSTGNPNFTYYGYEVTYIDTAAKFRVAWPEDRDPPGANAGCTVYNRQLYQTIKHALEACEFMQDSYDNDQTPFIYYAPHIPHNTGIAPGGYGQSFEKMYEDAVALPSGGLWYDGIEANVSPTSTNPPTSTQLTTWQAIVQQLASLDDAVGIMIEKLIELWGSNWTIMITVDNGNQVGEQNTRGDGSIKTAIWQGSCSPWLFVRGPAFAQGVRQTRVSSHADIGLTILDLFELTDNHMHEDRDGVSLLRVFDPDHVAYNRAIPVYGDWKTAVGEGYLDQSDHDTDGTVRKYVRNAGSPSSAGKIYDVRQPSDGGDPLTGYETQEITASTTTTPTLADATAIFDAIDFARWDPETNTNPAHDGTITV